MAKEIKEVKDFLEMSRRPDAKSVTIVSTNKKNKVLSKFKIRTSRYLYTLVVKNDRDRANKLEVSFPPTLVVKKIPKKA